MTEEYVAITPIEKDERADALRRRVKGLLVEERGYAQLTADARRGVDDVFASLEGMRFDSRAALERVLTQLLTPVAPTILGYVGLALDAAAREIGAVPGVLVIYAGGTIGSAPKDPLDPDSPQVVKPWADLKRATPQLSLLGYPIDAVSFVEPLDSCNVGPPHWRTIAISG